jgi:hypothetical protein
LVSEDELWQLHHLCRRGDVFFSPKVVAFRDASSETKCSSSIRCHHLLKTFWAGEDGWRNGQLPDGTVIWTAPGGRTYTTTPGSRLLFPELCQPTAPVVPVDVPAQPAHSAGLRMPRRRTTRTQDRARRINDERELNRTAAAAERAAEEAEQTAPDSTPPFWCPESSTRHRPIDVAHTPQRNTVE